MFNKRELITMVLSLQSKETEKKKKKTHKKPEKKKNYLILQEIRKLKHKFTEFKLENVVTKQTKSLLSVRLVEQCWANVQYSRRECIEVVVIPNSANNNELENKMLTVFQKMYVNYLHKNLRHIINSGKTVIG